MILGFRRAVKESCVLPEFYSAWNCSFFQSRLQEPSSLLGPLDRSGTYNLLRDVSNTLKFYPVHNPERTQLLNYCLVEKMLTSSSSSSSSSFCRAPSSYCPGCTAAMWLIVLPLMFKLSQPVVSSRVLAVRGGAKPYSF